MRGGVILIHYHRCIQLFNEMKKNNVEVTEVAYSTVMDAHARNGDMSMSLPLLTLSSPPPTSLLFPLSSLLLSSPLLSIR